MKLRFTMVLAAAAMLAGAAISYSVPEAWGGGFTSGGGRSGGFSGGGRSGGFSGGSHGGGFSGGARGFSGGMRSFSGGSRGMGAMRGMAVRPGMHGNNFQRGRSNNITRQHLNNSHIKSHPTGHTGKTNLTSKQGNQVKSFQSGQKKSFVGKQANFKKFSSHPQFKKANFSKKNFFSNSKFAGPHHRDRWHGHDHWQRWSGPVFWPYFVGDYFCYGFWPGDCADVYWGYGPDVIMWSAFWPSGVYYDEAAASEAADTGDIYRAPSRTGDNGPAPARKPDMAAIAETCAGFAPGVSDLPIGKLEGIIDATNEQRNALEDLKAAVAQASGILKGACPSEPPLTPVARLDAMQHRLQAMQQANVVIKAPFVRLFGLLSEQQKRRLEAVAKPAQQPQRAKKMDVTQLCTGQAGFTNVPTDQISNTLTLSPEQQQELDKLKAASAKASEELGTSCPTSMPDTLDARLDAAQQRVAALIGAVDTVRPAVRDFYASLTDEQKAALSIQPAPQKRG